jgi:hypothetical protein
MKRLLEFEELFELEFDELLEELFDELLEELFELEFEELFDELLEELFEEEFELELPATRVRSCLSATAVFVSLSRSSSVTGADCAGAAARIAEVAPINAVILTDFFMSGSPT